MLVNLCVYAAATAPALEEGPPNGSPSDVIHTYLEGELPENAPELYEVRTCILFDTLTGCCLPVASAVSSMQLLVATPAANLLFIPVECAESTQAP